jgi:RNA polymerase sigma-70 factor (ECF subfamily)
MTNGPAVALEQVEALEQDGRLSQYQYLPAIKADLLQRLGRTNEAAAAYRHALKLTSNETERAFLTARLTHHQISPA